MEKNKVYFSKSGLTSTSANHIANMAKEYVQTLQEELDSTNFLDGKIALIGQKFTSTQNGVTSLDYMQKDLDLITKSHSLIAWLREAIKAKDTLRKEISSLALVKWCEISGKEYPEAPISISSLDVDDVLATWSIKDRNHYLTLGARVSTYGKFLHPNGTFAKARKALKERINNPIEYKETGRDTIIKSYSPSISADEVDKKFYELQSEWRKAQAELNGYVHKIQLAINQDTNEKNTAYSEAQELYYAKLSALQAEFKEWKDNQLQEIANLKIVIPNALQDIYNIVTAL